MRRPFRRPNDDELDDEFLAHLAIEIQRRVDAGETPEEAERAARRDLGSIARVKEDTRAAWGLIWLESLLQDLKYGARVMLRKPGFTAVAVLTLALGIGANTAIFSVIDAALLRPLPFTDSGRLVRILATKNGAPLGSPSPMDASDYARAAHSFEGLIVYDHWRKNVTVPGAKEPAEMVVGLVPGTYFRLLGIQPLLGRLFTARENEYGNHYVAAISASLWRRWFGADPQILGRTLRINAESYVIVAVMPDVVPAWMDQTSVPICIWTPFAFPDIWTDGARAARGGYESLGRLRPGVSYREAGSELAGIAARMAREHTLDENIGTEIESLADSRAGPVRPVLLMLAGAVGMVLLIACSNLAGLLLARNSVRYREIAVRASLGAGRSRLIRQLLMETLLLSVAGGALGLLLASAAIHLLMSAAAGSSPYADPTSVAQFWSAGIQPGMLLFTFGISAATSLLFGLAPAFAGTRISLADTLREGGRSGSAGAGRQQFRRALVVAEIALSLVLVVAAGLLVESVVKLQHQNPGFRADHMLKAHIYLPDVRYRDSAARTRFCDELGRRIRELPGVVDASITTIFPPQINWDKMFTLDGRPATRMADVPSARFGVIDASYLRTMGIPLIAGRGFAASDTAASLPVALVNEAFVRRWFGKDNPIGHRIRLGTPPGLVAASSDDAGTANSMLTIVGVVRDFMNAGVVLPPEPQILALFAQQPQFNYGFKDLVVRTAMAPENTVSGVSATLHSLDPEIPLAEVENMSAYIADYTADMRLITALLGLFAALGTLLAVIGAYGVISCLVAQRTQEMGVRIALGADSWMILWLVLRRGVSMGFAGVAIGIAGSLAARKLLARFLFGVSGADPVTIAVSSALLLLVVIAATALPARRALGIDPVQALRSE